MSATFEVKIQKYDPTLPAGPLQASYRLEGGRKRTVLEVLREIYRSQDPDLCFRSSCGIGRCGACAVQVNGRAVLACQSIVEEADLVIEPLAGYPVLKDLIVDRSPYQERLKGLRPYLDRLGWESPAPHGSDEAWAALRSLSRCIECLACTSGCPVYGEIPQEFAGPALYTILAKWDLHPGNRLDRPLLALAGGIHNCTSCKSCSVHCPKGIDVFREAILRLRSANAAQGRGLPKMQKGFLPALAQSGKLYTSSSKRFTAEHGEVFSGTAWSREIGLFLGCQLEVKKQKQAETLVRILLEAGYRVVVPREQECCGGPLQWTGQADSLGKQVLRNVGLFAGRGLKTVVTACAGCGMTLKHDYPPIYQRLTGQELPFRVQDLTEALLSAESANPYGGLNLKITYHDPCHLNRGQGIEEQPRRLLKGIPGLELVEMPEADRCCGGMAVSANPTLAAYLAARKARSILSTGAQAAVTSCPTCQDVLRQALARAGLPVPVYLLSDLLSLARHSLGGRT